MTTSPVEPLLPGWCQHCRVECRDKTGAEIWPNRRDLAAKIVWVCVDCGARVGSHPDGKALGTAANEELRRAREMLHSRIDPIWENAFRHPSYESARQEGDEGERRKALAIIKKTARSRVYRFLAAKLELSKEETHVAMFSLWRCREAWVAIRGVMYDDVREWDRANPDPEKKKPAAR